MSDTTLSCRITPDYFVGATPLQLTIRLDCQTIFNQAITDQVEFAYNFASDEGQHRLEFELSGKTHAHSPWDSAGNGLADCQIHINCISFDEIDVSNIVQRLGRYTHSYNDPARDPVTEEFYSTMGCNGCVSFEFETPIYLWLLENM